MVNFDRPFSSFSNRFKAVAAGAALAFITGLAAAPVAASASGDAAPTVQNVAMVRAAEGTSSTTAADTAANSVAAKAVADAAPAAPAVPAAPAAAAPTSAQLHPTGIQGAQVGFTPTAEQMKNAQAIIQAGQAMGLPPRAWVIAVATSMQETALHNYGNLGASNDHDSLGLFQQRPTSGWGSATELQNPTYAAKAFYKALIQVPNWDKIPLTAAAQAVQVSAYPDYYAKWEAGASDVVQSFYGQGPLAPIAVKVM